MTGKTLRTISVMGVLATLLLTCVMLFSLDQITDTSTPRIAAKVHEILSRSLDGDPSTTRVQMLREGPGVRSPRRYVLRLQPSAAVATEPRAVENLLRHAAELCAHELEGVDAPVTVECVAELGQNGPMVRVYERVPTEYGLELRPVTASLGPAQGGGTADPVR